jgi:hypothetical protein
MELSIQDLSSKRNILRKMGIIEIFSYIRIWHFARHSFATLDFRSKFQSKFRNNRRNFRLKFESSKKNKLNIKRKRKSHN